MKKLIEFEDLDSGIQEYANKYFNGNFSKAVRSSCEEAIENDYFFGLNSEKESKNE